MQFKENNKIINAAISNIIKIMSHFNGLAYLLSIYSKLKKI